MKEIYEYLLKVYQSEVDRKKAIEDKAKFIFSVNSLILGGLIFKISDLPKSSNYVLQTATEISFMLSFCSVLISLFFILKTLEKQSFKGLYPNNLTDNLFNPNTKFYIVNNSDSFIDSISKQIALSIEHNRISIFKKNKNLLFSFRFLMVGIIMILLTFIISYYAR